MASAELRDELNCPICLSLFTHPVYLSCGHNFCYFCVVRVLDVQEVTGAYSCPECRAEYPERPTLEKNRKLSNIVEHFISSQPEEPPQIFCAYCDAPTPAVRTCLQCENSLCGKHLTVHNKTMDHILLEPTLSIGNKKCSLHKKLLEYYCLEDEACLCVSCCLVGEHWGHKMELLDEASEKRKEKLVKYINYLYPQRAKILTRVLNLQDYMWAIRRKASVKKANISKLFMDIRKQLDTAEAKALSEVFRQEKKAVSKISQLIQTLEVQEQEMSKKMYYMEEMCRVTDPIRLLQESDITGYEDDEDTWGDDGNVDCGEDLDEGLISLTLHRSMRDIVTYVTSELGIQVPDVLLDVDTAYNCIKISEDLKTATDSEEQDRPESSVRFMDYSHVLSRCGLSSGRHYWEVEWNQIGECEVGMCYPSVEREGCNSYVRLHAKSWFLFMSEESYDVSYNSLILSLGVKPQSPKLGVFLDYEAGRLSFYELSDPVTHLYTFTASFTEPLHVFLYLEDGASVKITS
ncbi:E3 ubiquitin-protein ligase TRIM39-like [Ranitomeya variabilis]|uniref:E3 ubiquitin-protein ligase TRIM39-like n=1 Tax=Ranitomeya variabilis TaxID=490064 RepID=UPI0040564197